MLSSSGGRSDRFGCSTISMRRFCAGARRVVRRPPDRTRRTRPRPAPRASCRGRRGAWTTSTARARRQLPVRREAAGVDRHVVGVAGDEEVAIGHRRRAPARPWPAPPAVGLDVGLARVEQDVVRQRDDHAAVANHDLELAGVDHRAELATRLRKVAARASAAAFCLRSSSSRAVASASACASWPVSLIRLIDVLAELLEPLLERADDQILTSDLS